MSFVNFEDFSVREKNLFYGEMLFDVDNVQAYNQAAQANSVREVCVATTLGITRNTTMVKRSFLKRYIIAHNNPYKSFWDGVIMILVLYSSFVTAYTYNELLILKNEKIIEWLLIRARSAHQPF